MIWTKINIFSWQFFFSRRQVQQVHFEMNAYLHLFFCLYPLKFVMDFQPFETYHLQKNAHTHTHIHMHSKHDNNCRFVSFATREPKILFSLSTFVIVYACHFGFNQYQQYDFSVGDLFAALNTERWKRERCYPKIVDSFSSWASITHTHTFTHIFQ